MDKPKIHQAETKYADFIFIKVDEKFRHLLSNERIAAKQELENAVCSLQDEVFLRTYSLLGLEADCDMLLWLMAADLPSVQKAWSRISTMGAGRFFQPAKCFLGLCQLPLAAKKDVDCAGIPKNLFGGKRYMVLHPLVRAHAWHELSHEERDRFRAERQAVLAKYPSVAEHFFSSCGLDDQEHVVIRESESLEDLAAASRELRERRIKNFTRRDTPNLLCVGSDLSRILDSLG